MLPHEKLFKKNLAEYIIHLYKTEELIRSFEFDLNKINEHVIQKIEITPQERKDVLLWYAQIISDMMEQGLDKKTGHLKEANQLVAVLQDLHNELLVGDKVYKEVFESAEPIIREHMSLSEGEVKLEAQACINSLYGLLLLRLQGKQVQNDQMENIEKQADVLSYLSKVYNQRRTDL